MGDLGNHRQFAAHAALLHTEPFEAIIDVEMLPGDILYIPPGFPHDGVTLDEPLATAEVVDAMPQQVLIRTGALRNKKLAQQLAERVNAGFWYSQD